MMGFMDDVSVEGSLSTMSSDVDLFRREGAKNRPSTECRQVPSYLQDFVQSREIPY